MRILSGGRRLEIVSASVSDTAEYRCVATNPAGTVTRPFQLFVFGKVLPWVIAFAIASLDVYHCLM